MSDQIESNESGDVDAESGMLSRRRVLGLGAAVAGGVWVAPAILSFDAASAETSGARPTTTVMTEPPTTTTTAAPRTITANVINMYDSVTGVVLPDPVTVAVGQPIQLVFTRLDPADTYNSFDIGYQTRDDTAFAGADYTFTNGLLSIGLGEVSATITIQTTATSPGSNTSFNVEVSSFN
jgi:hypothetical protein